MLEQLGFGSENVTWRSFYLAGALELREGAFGTPTRTGGKSSLSRYIRVSQILDVLAIAIEAPKAWDLDLELDLVIVDLDERHRVTLRNGVLIHRTVGEEIEAAGDDVASGQVASAPPAGRGTRRLLRMRATLPDQA